MRDDTADAEIADTPMMKIRAKRLAITLTVLAVVQFACGDSRKLTELERAKTGTVEVVLLSPGEGLHHGRDSFVLEFRSNGMLIDVGKVSASATMPMPGMPMFGTIQVQRTDVPGRYAAVSEFSMAGRWRLTVEWDGGAAPGSVSFTGTVQ